ncbi:MAG: hypothetical protein R3C46_01305 [Hyphomonadaceae bacterium]
MTRMRTYAANNNGAADHLAGRVAESMNDFSDRAKRAMTGAGDMASDVANNAVRSSRAATKFVVKEVREHPLRTLAIGAAVGLVVAAVLMLRNRSHDED